MDKWEKYKLFVKLFSLSKNKVIFMRKAKTVVWNIKPGWVCTFIVLLDSPTPAWLHALTFTEYCVFASKSSRIASWTWLFQVS